MFENRRHHVTILPWGVDDDLLDWNEDQRLLDGVPYTGPAYSLWQNGALDSQAFYVNGFHQGLVLEWHRNGMQQCAWYAVRGQLRGECLEWYDNGVVKYKKWSEFGVELEYTEWSLDGRIVERRQLDPNSPLASYLLTMREAEKKRDATPPSP